MSAARVRARADRPPSAAPGPAPADAEALRGLLLARYGELSPVFQRIARFVLDEPNIVALETLSTVAGRCGAPPSTIVRFAQSLGFEGAAPMQRLLRDGLMIGGGGRTYGERVRRYARGGTGAGREAAADDPASILHEGVDGAVQALHQLEELLGADALLVAAERIRAAEVVHLVGFRRAFPVAAYLSYGLQGLGRRTLLIDGAGGLAKLQAGLVTSRDVLLSVSFSPYAPETLEVVQAAAGRDCPLISVTDSVVSPTAQGAAVVLLVREPEVRGFRPLTTSMCLAHALVLACAFAGGD